MADGVCGKGYQPHNMSRVSSTSEDTAISHTGYVRPVDQARTFELISERLLEYVSTHSDGPPGKKWWRDKHWRVDYHWRDKQWRDKHWGIVAGLPYCLDGACLCCRQDRFGLHRTECEQCRTAWIMSTVNREVARAVRTDASVSKWGRSQTINRASFWPYNLLGLKF